MNLGWDANAAANHLRSHAQARSQGRCAAYTREAVEAGGGGVKLKRAGSAKDYGPSLVGSGFIAMDFTPIGGYQKGDVAVIQPIPGHPHGHMQMFDGSKWISDFVQRDFWPGPSYRSKRPAFTVYRFRVLFPQQITSTSAMCATNTSTGTSTGAGATIAPPSSGTSTSTGTTTITF